MGCPLFYCDMFYYLISIISAELTIKVYYRIILFNQYNGGYSNKVQSSPAYPNEPFCMFNPNTMCFYSSISADSASQVAPEIISGLVGVVIVHFYASRIFVQVINHLNVTCSELA